MKKLLYEIIDELLYEKGYTDRAEIQALDGRPMAKIVDILLNNRSLLILDTYDPRKILGHNVYTSSNLTWKE
jgi:hypothetical protein